MFRRLALRQNTMALATLTLSGVHPVIWRVDGLPYDAWAVVPMPLPLGGVLVLCVNALFHISPTSSFGLSLNYFAETYQHTFPLNKLQTSPLILTLDCAHFTFLDALNFLVSDKLGDLYLFHFTHDNVALTHIDVAKIGEGVVTSSVPLPFVFSSSV
jgi:hypothetical protein